MVAYNKFNAFTLKEGQAIVNFDSDQLVVALCAAANAPVATNSVLADLTQISYTNLSSRNITTTSWSQASGTAKLVLADLILTASGSVATFRYVVIYDDTATGDPLICWFDYGSNVTLAAAETFTIDFSAANGLLQST